MTTATRTLRLSVLQENLNNALSAVGRVVGDRHNSLPITTHVHLEAAGEWLTLRTTDLEGYIVHQMAAKVETEGAICLPYDRLAALVAALPNGTVTLTLAENGRNVTIVCARRTARMSGLDAEEFPPERTVLPGATEVVMSAPVLREGLRRVLKVAATKEDRLVLCGIFMTFQGATFTLASADGFRLAEQRLTLPDMLPEPVAERRTVLIPATLLTEVYGLLAKEDGNVTIVLPPLDHGSDFVHFLVGRTDMACIQIVGQYPNYGQLIPPQTGEYLTVDQAALTQTVRIAAVFGEGLIRLIPHQVEVGHVEVSAKGDTDDAACELDADIRGNVSETAVEARYLLDALDALGPGKITLQAHMPSSPVVFRKVEDGDYVHVMMPRFVQK